MSYAMLPPQRSSTVRSRARFAFAVAASVAVHAWLAATGGTGVVRDAGTEIFQAPIHASLGREQVVPPEAEPVFAVDGEEAPPAVRRTNPQPRAPAGPVVLAEPAVPATHAGMAPSAASGPSAAFPDLQYYPVRQLDVLPALNGVLQLDYPDRAARAGVGGRVQAMVMIDEAGVVTDVTVANAEPAGYFEDAARAALAAARFTPARRGERPVRSRVLIGVTYDPAETTGRLR